MCAYEGESWGGFLEGETVKQAPETRIWANPLFPHNPFLSLLAKSGAR